jgi:hypothetical protein
MAKPRTSAVALCANVDATKTIRRANDWTNSLIKMNLTSAADMFGFASTAIMAAAVAFFG